MNLSSPQNPFTSNDGSSPPSLTGKDKLREELDNIRARKLAQSQLVSGRFKEAGFKNPEQTEAHLNELRKLQKKYNCKSVRSSKEIMNADIKNDSILKLYYEDVGNDEFKSPEEREKYLAELKTLNQKYFDDIECTLSDKEDDTTTDNSTFSGSIDISIKSDILPHDILTATCDGSISDKNDTGIGLDDLDTNISEHQENTHDDGGNDKSDHDDNESIADENGWRFWISQDEGAKFPPESDRYHLYVAHGCHWSHRTVIVLSTKGLTDVIGLTYAHPTWQYTKPGVDDHRGWVFQNKDDDKPLTNTDGYGSFPASWGDIDTVCNAKSVREIYESANDSIGHYTLPLLWDKKLRTIVSNESSEIIRMLDSEFNDYAKNPSLSLYPEELREKIDEVNSWIYPAINDGVYRCGLAPNQTYFNTAINDFNEAFDRIESILENQQYIAGNDFTEADIRLFVTLFGFDEVYNVYFLTDTRNVSSCPTILNYVRDIYQIPGIKDTCNMAMIKAHFFTSHVELNKYSIIPRGENFVGLLDTTI